MDYIIIEQTKEYTKRISYDPITNTFSELEHDCIFLHRNFTHPYGWLKGYGTPPDEHLDVFLLSHDDCSLGDELPVKIVGVFKRNDGDNKFIGISPERKETDFTELPENEKNDLFRLYPKVGNGEGWFGAETAKEIIEDFMKHGRVV
jgi:inorganic pyrophosphatase